MFATRASHRFAFTLVNRCVASTAAAAIAAAEGTHTPADVVASQSVAPESTTAAVRAVAKPKLKSKASSPSESQRVYRKNSTTPQTTSIASDISALNALTIDVVLTIDQPKVVLEHAQRYLTTLARFDKAFESPDRATRLRSRLARKTLTVGGLTRQTLFLRLIAMTESGDLTLDDVIVLFGLPWPFSLGQILGQLRCVVVAQVSELIRNTVQAHKSGSSENKENTDASTTTTPPTPPTHVLLTPQRARYLLRYMSSGFPMRSDLIGPLATIATYDLDTLVHPTDVLRVMFAVHRAGTHAPEEFWRRIVRRMAAIHKQQLVPMKAAQTASVEPAAAAASATTRGLTPRDIFRMVRILKREKWSSDVATLSLLVSEALKNILDAFRSHPHRIQWPSQPLPVNKATGALNSEAKEMIAQRVRDISGLDPEDFLSLLVIGGELGNQFGNGFLEMSDTIIAPTIRLMRAPQEMKTLCVMLRVTRNHTVSLFQAIIDTLVRLNQVPNRTTTTTTTTQPSSTSVSLAEVVSVPARERRFVPATIPVVELVMREVVRTKGLAHQLHLIPFIELILFVCREKKKFSPTTILSFTDNLFHIQRLLMKTSPFAQAIRETVDEFAFQLERMLCHSLVSVNLVSTFLEHTVMLGMKDRCADLLKKGEGEGDASVEKYANTQRLRQTRDALYQECQRQHRPFKGIIVPTSASLLSKTVSVVDIYQLVFSYSMSMMWQREKVSHNKIVQFRRVCFDSGVYVSIEATRLYKLLHTERATSMESSTIPIPLTIKRTVLAAVRDRLRTCGLADPKGLRELDDSAVQMRVAMALGLPSNTVVTPAMLSRLVDAVVGSPLGLSSEGEIVSFLTAAVCRLAKEDSLLVERVMQFAKNSG